MVLEVQRHIVVPNIRKLVKSLLKIRLGGRGGLPVFFLISILLVTVSTDNRSMDPLLAS